jgi:hypothetical protein
VKGKAAEEVELQDLNANAKINIWLIYRISGRTEFYEFVYHLKTIFGIFQIN